MKKKKLLIIDDIVSFSDSLKERLEKEGFVATVANNGYEGLQKATEQQPDLILLDIDMPDIQGNEVLSKIKEKGIKTRVIIVTGTGTTIQDAVRHIREGACDYYVKDMNMDVLINQIRRALSLETTLNLMISNPAPIIEQSMANIERLSYENDELRTTNNLLEQKLNYKPLIITSAVNLSLLVVAVVISLLIRYFASITDFWIILILVVGLFFLLRFPIEKISKMSVKVPKTEANFEIEHPIESNQKQLPKKNL